ncbi:MAG: AAA family ATPase [Actinobacteria bacterium]|nr:AAA family ATPase [Actinomycetota bacterium]
MTPLIGREREMDVLTNALDVSIAHARCQMVLLLGEAGVGKSRVAAEVAEIAAIEHGAFHLSGRCVPYGEANPWWPVAEVLRSGCGVGRDDGLDLARERTARAVASVQDPHDGSETSSIVDGLLHLMGYEGPLRGLEGSRARAEASQALIRFLEASVRRRPLMVRVSDLHWADPAVLELVDGVLRQLARQPFLLVATARPSLQDRWTPGFGRCNSLVLNLDPLDRGASALLLDALVGLDVDDATRATLLDRAGGNPFYLEELVSLVGSRIVAGEHDEAVAAAALPDTLRGLVAARIDGLGPEEQQVIEDAAVWGASGPLDALDRIAVEMRGLADVSRIVRTLVEADVFELDGTEWSFRSDLVREVVYARLTKRERLGRHLGIAEYIERLAQGGRCDDATLDTVTRHFVTAARLDAEVGASGARTDLVRRAVDWSMEAARRAEHEGSWRRAERLYSDALELAGADDATQRCDASIGRSRVRAEAWDERGAAEDATAALALAEQLGDPRRRALSLLRRATALARSGATDESDGDLGEAIEVFDSIGDLQGRADALRERGLASLLRSDTRAAEAPIAEALEAFRSLGDRRGEAWSLQNLAWIALSDGRIEDADSFVAESVAAFRALGDPGGLAWAQGLVAFARLQRGELDDAADIAGPILRECEVRGDRFGEAMMLTVLAHVELWRGRTTAAAASAERAVAAFRSSSDMAGTVGLEQALAVAGRAAVMLGDLDGGRELLEEAVTAAVGTADGGSFALGVSLVTSVQVGRPGRLLDQPLDRWVGAVGRSRASMHEATYALALAQGGRIEEALALARRAAHGAADGDPAAQDAAAHVPPSGYALAVLALVAAAAGAMQECLVAAEQVEAGTTSTYLDRIWAAVAVAVADPGARGAQWMERAEVLLAGTDDVVAAGLVELADRVRRARSEGRPPDVGDVADSAWAALLARAALAPAVGVD